MRGRLSIIALGVAAVLIAAVAVVLATGPWSRNRRAGTRAASVTGETIPQPSLDKLLPRTRAQLAPDSARVDLAMPSFSKATEITNPLFPISRLRSALIVGRFNGKPLRIETTLLPGTKVVDWNGRHVRTRRSQFVAYLGGRIYEVAVDLYAQANDGGVWYFGEDAFSYTKGRVAGTGDTWVAGVDGPAALIMPGHPRVGDVYRTENVPGHVFEEVTVKRLGVTVHGPTGAVPGAMVGRELHMEGDVEDKSFAPGYGEFFSGLGRDYEANALAIPADAVHGAPPPQLSTLSIASARAYESARAKDWTAAAAAQAQIRAARDALRGTRPPVRLDQELTAASNALRGAVAHRAARPAALAALEVTNAGLDLELRHRPAAEVDRGRLDLHARRIAVDAAAGDVAAVRGDVTTLEWIRGRLALETSDATRIDDQLRYLRGTADARELGAAASGAARLRGIVASLHPRS